MKSDNNGNFENMFAEFSLSKDTAAKEIEDILADVAANNKYEDDGDSIFA